MGRVLGVIRLSKSTDESTSPERQRSAIQKRAEADGHEVVAWAEDLDVSGSVPAAQRPELGKYLTLDGLKAWDVMVAMKLDRVSRNFLDFVSLLELLHSHNKTLVVAGDGIDTSTDVGRMVAQLLAVIGEFERASIRSRVNDRTTADLRAGVWRGETVPGHLEPYRDDAGRWRLRLSEAAPRYRKVVEMVTSGKSIAEAAEWLDGPTAGGLAKLLRSRVLVGDRELPDGKVVRGADGVPVAYAEPLLTRDEYERLQAALDGRLGRARTPNGVQLLTRLVRCSVILDGGGECGQVRTFNRTVQGHARWVCPIPGHGTVNAPRLQSAFTNHFLSTYGDVHTFDRVYHPGDDTAEELVEVERLMAELREERSMYRADEFRQMYEPLVARRDRLEENPGRPAAWEIVESEHTVRDTWNGLTTVEARNDFLRVTGVQVWAKRTDGVLDVDIRIAERMPTSGKISELAGDA